MSKSGSRLDRQAIGLLALLWSCFVACGADDSGLRAGIVADDAFEAHLALMDELVKCEWSVRSTVVGRCVAGSGKERYPVLLVHDESAIPEAMRELDGLYREKMGLISDPETRAQATRMMALTEPWVVGEIASLGDGPIDAEDRSSPGPAPLGGSISHDRGKSGTLGCRLRDPADPSRTYLLTAWHVLVPDEDVRRGDPILHPGLSDRGDRHTIGRVARWKAVDKSGTADNRMDAAIGETSATCVANSTPGAGGYTPSAEPVAADGGMIVLKHGRTTDETTGRVRCVDATLCIRYGKLIRFINQIVIERSGDDPFCLGGDSGSLVVHEQDGKHRPLGLLFGKSRKLRGKGKATRIRDACIASPIGPVLEELGNLEIDDSAAVVGGDCNLPGHPGDPAPSDD